VGLAMSLYAAEYGHFLFDKKAAKELNLTADQNAALEKIRFESAEKKIDLDANIKKLELKLRAETKKDEPDADKVMNLIDEIGKSKTEIAKINTGNMLAARKILTPEQREKARDMAEKWAETKKQEEKPGVGMCPMMGGKGMAGPGMMPGMAEKAEKPGMMGKQGKPGAMRRGMMGPMSPAPTEEPATKGDTD
ncbi:MAG: Spy/CpxP family protein refolding chaperone, partial [Candidatus Sumerlaeota bacterium]|nr:Spy/CpxP family protein refolding chaperone [Candidatus Sumerlaeota bacterium]